VPAPSFRSILYAWAMRKCAVELSGKETYIE
jgi:hypothetical protein